MHYDFAIACRTPIGPDAGDIGARTRLLIEHMASAGKRCAVFVGTPEGPRPFIGHDRVDFIAVEMPSSVPYATLWGDELIYAYALCETITAFLKLHTVQIIEFPDLHAEGYFFINQNIVYRRIPTVAVRLHSPSFVINDDNARFSCSLHEARIYADEQEALHQADHIRYPDLIHIEPPQSFYPCMWSVDDLRALLEERHDTPQGAYSIPPWAHLWWSPERNDFSSFNGDMLTERFIREVDTTCTLAARPFLPRAGRLRTVFTTWRGAFAGKS